MRSALAALVFLTGAPAFADEARGVTLSEAIAYARAHHPDIRAAAARVAAQRAVANVPRAQWLPTFRMTAQLLAATENNTTASYVGQPRLDIPRIGGTKVISSNPTFEPSASTFAAVGGLQELFDFGRIASQAAAEDALVDVEKERARGRELDVSFFVEESFFAVLASKAVQKASEDAYDRAKGHRDLAKAQVDSGMRPAIELTRAEADLARFDAGRVRARGDVAVAQAELAAAVGTDEAALDAKDAPPPEDVPSLGAALERASARDPRLHEIAKLVQAEAQRTRAIGAELRPDLYLTATFSGRAGGAPPTSGPSTQYGGWVPYVPNWDVGVVFSWPIYDGTVLARRDASRAREEVRRDELELVRQADVAAVRRAWIRADVARATLPALERAVLAATANYAQADARFRAGLVTSVELADAELVRTRAEIEYALGEFDVARARAALGRAIAEGGP